MRGLVAQATQALDRYLSRTAARPLAVALSGGGDSRALTLLADGWARGAGRELIVLTVDHGLNPASTGWTADCAALAARLGRPFRALAWTGPKPTTGLPAAARAARHALLADAARAAGAQVLLMGHTADDVREAAAMRNAGSTTPSPRTWSPSPAWPEGRGVLLLRPLLAVDRADLRTWLAAEGEAWIDDPANQDPRFARSRARGRTADVPPPPQDDPPLRLAEAATEASGVISIARSVLRDAAPNDARRFLRLACVCAGGGNRLPPADRVVRLTEAVRGPQPVTATLAGARIEADEQAVRLFREAGEAARGGLAEISGPGVWDGRFEIGDGAAVRRLAGLTRRLADPSALRGLPAAARGALPVTVDGEIVRLAEATSLVGARLRAAAGLVQRETD